MACSERLLILSCSKRKLRDSVLIPALTRYNGPLFQIVRKFARDCPESARQLGIFILSAEFGLICGDQPLPHYDRRMTRQRALELHSATMANFKRILRGTPPSEWFISVGQDYLRALAGYEMLLPASITVRVSSGTLGHRQAELRDWLRDHPQAFETLTVLPDQRRFIRVRGVEFALSPAEACVYVQRALRQDPEGAQRFQSWYVEVDGQRVAPKWYVSCLTGLAVSDFTTDDARRVLRQLGIFVHRV